MASNFFGNYFRVTTWGESHGRAMGAVIDGCPAGLEITREEIQRELDLRRPGKNPYLSPRKEMDEVEILSGIYEGKTTGSPISLIVYNRDAQKEPYKEIENLHRPGHASWTYLKKWGIYDPRGGGRASARETLSRVAAGAVAKKFLFDQGIKVAAYLASVGPLEAKEQKSPLDTWVEQKLNSPLFTPDLEDEAAFINLLNEAIDAGDSLGGSVRVVAEGVPPGIGDPVYEKLSANIAKGLASIPAVKGILFGDALELFQGTGSRGNDQYSNSCDGEFKSNRCGGILGGISTGMAIDARVLFKPTSSIKISQDTVDYNGNPAKIIMPLAAKHDPCVAIRAVPVVEAMMALSIIDALLSQRMARFASAIPLCGEGLSR